MNACRSTLRGIVVYSTFLLAGCASYTHHNPVEVPASEQWAGRISIQVQSTPVQSLSATFDLQGNVKRGSLSLTTPLGSTLARLLWGENIASLQANGQTQQFDSLNEMVRHATGTDLPIDSLFSWLQGVEADSGGWKVDLSELPNGRIYAQRLEPFTPVSLKIILDH